MSEKPKARRGFAVMSEEKRREIARKGGAAVPKEKRGWSRDHEAAAEAGRKSRRPKEG